MPFSRLLGKLCGCTADEVCSHTEAVWCVEDPLAHEQQEADPAVKGLSDVEGDPAPTDMSDQQTQQLADMLRVLLQQTEAHYHIQSAAEFSKLLCVSRALQQKLLQDNKRCIKADLQAVSWPDGDEHRPDNMLDWLEQQLNRGTIGTLSFDCCHQETCDRAAGILAKAAEAGEQVLLPVAINWRSTGLVPDTLSKLPPGLLQRLTLYDITSELPDSTLSELGRLNSLQVLRLPWVNPVEGSLAPSLSALTSLTSLLIRHPYPPEQQALRCSLVELTVAQELPPILPPRAGEGYSRPALPPLKISHLTALKVLQVREGAGDASDDQADDDAAHAPSPAAGVTEEYELPNSLHRLVVRGISSVQPLRALPQLKLVELTHADIHTPWEQLLQLTQVSAVKRLVLPANGSPPTVNPAQLRPMALAAAALCMDCTQLSVLGSETSTWDGAAVQALSSITSLVSLTLKGVHSTPDAAAAVTPSQLAGALSALTRLTELQLVDIDNLHAGEENVGEEIETAGTHLAPVLEAVARLPSLQKLHMAGFALGSAISALSKAPALVDLDFGPGMKLQEMVVLELFGAGFKSSSSLRRLRLADAYQQRISDKVRAAITRSSPQLTSVLS